MPRWAPILIIIGLFVGFAAWYANVTPYRTAGRLIHQRGNVPDVGAPDERQHANYISHLVKERSFPVLRPGAPDLIETYQSHQPPLYYLIAAAMGEPTKATRYLNIIFGVCTIFALYRLGQLAGKSDSAGWACASFGLLPGFIMLNAAITNDSLLFALCTTTLTVAIDGSLNGWTWKKALLVGVLAGLALLTKSSALALIPALGVVWLLELKRKSISPITLGLGIIALPLAIAAPWFARNAALYGDPLGLTVFKQAFTGSAQASMFINEVGPIAYWSDWVLWWTARSFVGVFGYMDIFLPNTLYFVVIGGLLLALAGHWLSTGEPLGKPDPRPSLVLGTFFVVVLLLFLQFNMTYFQGQARYLYPAMGPIAAALGIGLSRWFGKKPIIAWIASALGLTILNFYILTSVLPTEFARRIN